MHELILASKSPRRSHILKAHGFKFSIASIETSEFFDKNLSLNDALTVISRAKVEAVLNKIKLDTLPYKIIIGCDTVVCLKGQVLGKPQDKSIAFEYLSRLSGISHEVRTSVTIFDTKEKSWLDFVEMSKVKFKVLSKIEIDQYVESGEPMDMAGAYAIQGLGGKFVEKYEGSFDNIVGFPLERFMLEIKNKKWISDVNS